MKNKNAKKVVLSRETVRRLQPKELNAVAGGMMSGGSSSGNTDLCASTGYDLCFSIIGACRNC